VSTLILSETRPVRIVKLQYFPPHFANFRGDPFPFVFHFKGSASTKFNQSGLHKLMERKTETPRQLDGGVNFSSGGEKWMTE
jgi:hypothetical protein